MAHFLTVGLNCEAMSAACVLLLAAVVLAGGVPAALCAECGLQAGGTLCPEFHCCSADGECGTSSTHCLASAGCQSGCWAVSPSLCFPSLLCVSVYVSAFSACV